MLFLLPYLAPLFSSPYKFLQICQLQRVCIGATYCCSCFATLLNIPIIRNQDRKPSFRIGIKKFEIFAHNSSISSGLSWNHQSLPQSWAKNASVIIYIIPGFWLLPFGTVMLYNLSCERSNFSDQLTYSSAFYKFVSLEIILVWKWILLLLLLSFWGFQKEIFFFKSKAWQYKIWSYWPSTNYEIFFSMPSINKYEVFDGLYSLWKA